MLTTSAFETFLGPARVELGRMLGALSAGLEDDERLSQSVRTFIEQHPFPPALQARIVKAFAELAERTELGERLSTAVLSSGVSEDGADASFAGQYDTYRGLRSAEGVLECVRKCWSSNWGFGQSVVSGLVSPDHVLVQRPDGDIWRSGSGLKRCGASSTPSKAGSSSSRRRRSKPDVRA